MAIDTLVEHEPKNKTNGVSRREFVRRGLWAGAGAVVLGGYSTLFEPNRIVTRFVDIPVSSLPDALEGFKIAQISDIHFGEFLGESHLRRVVKQVNDLQPDIVTVTGDFVTRPDGKYVRRYSTAAQDAEPCAKILSELRSVFGTFSVLGNHDHTTDPDLVTAALQSHGIRVLRNESFPTERDGARLWLAGIDDVLLGAARPEITLAKLPANEPIVALVHEPDYADVLVKKYRVDLQLSGHSHGGQVRLPFIGAPILPDLARKYPLGLRKVKDTLLYTNPGVGVITLPVRFDCPPEITLLKLRRGA